MNKSSLNGYAHVDLFGIEAEGNFVDGKIKSGVVKVGGFEYYGTFDDDTLVHGNECSIIRDSIRYDGKFVHGKLISGNMYVDGVKRKKGHFVSSNNSYELSKGWRITDDGWKESGLFTQFEMLLFGEKTNGVQYYSGMFDGHDLIAGTYRNIVKGRVFNANVIYNNEKKLIYCKCEWDGMLEDLNDIELAMILCNGSGVFSAHKMYCKHFQGKHIFQTGETPYVDRSQLTESELKGLLSIIKNINKHKKNSPLMKCQTPKPSMYKVPNLELDPLSLTTLKRGLSV